jgi:hypothetical protein
LAPACANRCPIANPIPLEAPVTIAVRPVRSSVVICYAFCCVARLLEAEKSIKIN